MGDILLLPGQREQAACLSSCLPTFNWLVLAVECSDQFVLAGFIGCLIGWCQQEYCDSGTLGKQASSWTYEDDTQMLKRLLLLQDVVKGLR